MAVETTISPRPRLIPSTRFLLALLVSFAYLLQHAQRMNLSIAIVCMVDKTKTNLDFERNTNNISIKLTSLFFEERQFLWSEWHQQIILGSYWVGNLITLVPSGWLSITMGAKRMYTMAIFISSLATIALSGLYYLENISFPLIVALRILIGATHGAVYPVTYTLWAQWAVPDERGTLLSISFSGSNLGTSIIVLVGGVLCRYVYSGWIHIFFISGILGFIWLPFWMWQVSDSPENHRSISNTEREYIGNILGKHVQNQHRRPISLGSLPWKNILRSKPVIGLFFTQLCSMFGFIFFLSNFGKILTEIHRIPTQYTGDIFACGALFMFLSGLISGIIADSLVQKNLITLTNVRKLFNSLNLFIPCLCMIAFYFCDEKQQTLGVISVLLFLLSSGLCVGSGYVVNYSDITPAYSSLICGLATTVSSLSGVLGNVIAGVLIKHPTLHEWRKLFILFFFVHLFGGIIFLILGSAVPEEWATFEFQEQAQNNAQSQEERLPMKEQIKMDETNQATHVTA